MIYVILIFCIYKIGSFGAVSVLEVNHADLKMVPFLVPEDFSWTASTGLEEMQLKIERDESDRRRGS